MKINIHHEFAYQSRELGAQIEDTLGEPPNRKNYAIIIASLIAEYTKNTEINDVNMLSFALVEHLSFNDRNGLLAQCKQYDQGDAANTISMVTCADPSAAKALATVASNNPDLARKAILTAFLFKNNKLWTDADNSLDALQQEEEENEKGGKEVEDDDYLTPGQDFVDIFDTHEDGNV
jgi:hypothetical protein